MSDEPDLPSIADEDTKYSDQQSLDNSSPLPSPAASSATTTTTTVTSAISPKKQQSLKFSSVVVYEENKEIVDDVSSETSSSSRQQNYLSVTPQIGSSRSRHDRLKKALKVLGSNLTEFERQKALAVLGVTEKQLHESEYFFHKARFRMSKTTPDLSALAINPSTTASTVTTATSSGDIDMDFKSDHEKPASAPDHGVDSDDIERGPLSDPQLRHEHVVSDGDNDHEHERARAHRHHRRRRRASLPHIYHKPARVLGMDDTQLSRLKALEIMGVTDFEVDDYNARALAHIGNSVQSD